MPMDFFELLKTMVDRSASDLFLSAGAPPNLKVQGVTAALAVPAMHAGEVKELAYSAMTDRQRRDFERDLECNLAINAEGIGRFRLTVFQQKGEVGMVARYIKAHIPSLAELGLPRLL